MRSTSSAMNLSLITVLITHLIFYSSFYIRFRILDCTVWNVKLSEDETLLGQAATFSAWEEL